MDHGTAMPITHNLGPVARYTQRAVVLCKGWVIEAAPPSRSDRAARDLRANWSRRCRGARYVHGRQPANLDERARPHVEFDGRRQLFGNNRGSCAADGVDLDIGAGGPLPWSAAAAGQDHAREGDAAARSVRRGTDLSRQGGAGCGRQGFGSPRNWCFRIPIPHWIPACASAIVAEPPRHVAQLAAAERQTRRKILLTRSAFGFRGPLAARTRADSGNASPSRAIVRGPRFVVADELRPR